MDGDQPLSSVEGIAAAFAKAKAKKEREEAQGLKATTRDAEAANKQGEVRFKASHGILIAFFTLIFLLHAGGLYLFTSGFLLTRLVLDNQSQCGIPPIDIKPYVAGSSTTGCWHPKSFDKAIVVIIDALRYDFVIPHSEDPRHFHNAIPVLHETASKSPANAVLLPFIADPPTTTLQRLKGLTTGTLPTFLDAGTNFAGTAIDEDNIIAQLKTAGRRVVHLGDDTWHSLFPGYFEPNLTHAYESFNVWDLHTVDNGVTEHIFPLMHPSNTTKWDVLIGHYLGVDHAGHRYGPDHPAMAAKLNQLDGLIRDLIAKLEDNTLLVIMGDHGMDAKGDHGGESDDEVQSTLWMYSKQKFFGRTAPEHVQPPATAKERPVAQIDLVPTLSLLLGLPIPFNNLGGPIQEAFVGVKGDNYENLATVNRLTAAQIHRYQHEYTAGQGSGEDTQSLSASLWNTANNKWTSLSTKHTSQSQHKSAAQAFRSYQSHTLSVCRDLWAKFDVGKMSGGVALLAGTLVLLGLYARGLTGDISELTPTLLFQGGTFAILGALSTYCIKRYLSGRYSLDNSFVIPGAMVGFMVGSATALWGIRGRIINPLPRSIWGWSSVVFTVALSAGFAANSFTIWEDEILLHFLATFGIMATISSLRQQVPVDRILGCYHSILFTLLTRVASLSRLCREEQMPYCRSTYYASDGSSTSATWQLAIPLATALLIPSFIRAYYGLTRNDQGTSTTWFDFGLRFGLLLSAAYWALDAADNGDWYPGYGQLLASTKTIVAQITLAIAFAFGYPTFVWSKPFISIQSQARGTNRASTHVVSDGGSSSIAILGYANVHGSRYAFLVTIWYLAISLLQKPMGAGAIGITVWQIFSLYEIVDINNLSDTSIAPVVLGLMGSYHFFKTGHQATLASIQWDSAFIPLSTIRYPWTPIIIILNSFGAQILCAVAVPGIVLWKKQPKKRGLLGDVAKAIATHMLFYAVISFATCVWAGHLRRHLMLYRVFSPRYMTGGLVLLVVDVVAIFVALGGTRFSFLSVAEVFGW